MGCGSSKTTAVVPKPDQNGNVEKRKAETSKELQIQSKKAEEKNKKAAEIPPTKRAKLEEEVPPAAVNIFDVLHGKVPVPDQAPVPESVEDLDVKVGNIVYVPEEPAEPLLTIEDTFWSEKKRVMPDLKALKHVEDHALKAPSSVKSSPESLAAYLVKPCETDIEKLRAIYWWVTHNIKYDVRLLNEGIRHGNTPQDVLNSGAAVCEGYAGLCFNMMKSVGFEVEKISGTSKGAGYWPGIYSLVDGNTYDGAHAWNKVKIQGTWFLMDATWSAGACSSETGKHQFDFKWDETYFLVEPEGFICDHLPLETNLNPSSPEKAQVLPQEQLLHEPLLDFKTWDNTPHIKPICHFLGLKPLSHSESVIYTSTNQVNIKLSSRIPINMWVFLKKRTKKYITTLPEMTWISNNGEEIEVCARLPGQGTYHLEICGHPWRLEKQPESHNNIWVSIEYTIVAEGKVDHPRFPVRTKGLGPSLRFLDAGFKVGKPTECVLQANDGHASVVIEMPDKYDLTPLWVNLYKSNSQMNQRHLLVERYNKFAIIHAIALEKGEYLLDIVLPSRSNSGMSGAAFLVENGGTSQRQNREIFPDFCHKLMGPQEIFLQNKIKMIYPRQSTIFTKDGKATIIIKEETPVDSFVAFEDMNGNRVDRYVSTETKNNMKFYKLNIQKPGIYLMQICMPPQGYPGANFIVVYPNTL